MYVRLPEASVRTMWKNSAWYIGLGILSLPTQHIEETHNSYFMVPYIEYPGKSCLGNGE